MHKFKNLVIGGIENKVFNLILVAMLVVAAAFMLVTQHQADTLSRLAGESSQRQRESITSITGSVMDQVITGSMDRTAGLEAFIADDMFASLGTRVQLLGDYAGKLFSDPSGSPRAAWAPPDPGRNGEVTAQMFLADGTDEASIGDRLGLAANMSDMMISLFGVSDMTNSCFIALPEGAFLVADDRSAAKFDEAGKVISYDPRTRPWYIQAVEAGGLIFTDVETDAFTGDTGIVCAMPVYADGRLEAVVGSDLFLTAMQQGVEASDENGGFLFVVNRAGHVIFSPRKDGLFAVTAEGARDLRAGEEKELAAFVTEALAGAVPARLVTLSDGTYYMASAPLDTVGWALVAVFDQKAADQPSEALWGSYEQIQAGAAAEYRASARHSRLTVTVLLIVLMALLLAASLILGRRIVRPLNRMTEKIASLREDDPEFKMEDAYRTGDEIQVLAESFADLSHRTTLYVDEVRRITAEKERIGTELHMANQIQESMLPSIFPAFPDRPEFDIYATMEPARDVGGDFYDFFLIDEDHLCMVIADVSGKGVPAALFMMITKIIVQSCAMLGRSAGEILTKTNEALCSNNRMEMFVTAWLGILEISTGRLTAANAGHEYPALARKGGAFETLRDTHGFVIGGMDSVKYREYQVDLKAGDRIFLYTDGVTEATDAREELFGRERMLAALNARTGGTPQDVLHRVREAVRDFVKDADQFDDMTMLCMEYKGARS